MAKITVKGKYLSLVEAFVDSLRVGESASNAVDDSAFRALTKWVATVHGSYLTLSNAEMQVLGIAAEVAAEAKALHGRPFSAPECVEVRSELIKRLAEAIESYPRAYEGRFVLPSIRGFGPLQFDLGYGLFFIMKAAMPDVVGFASRELISLDEDAVYLQVEVAGSIDQSMESPTAHKCIDRVNQVLFLLRAYGLTEAVRFRFNSHGLWGKFRRVGVGDWTLVNLPYSLSRHLATTRIRVEASPLTEPSLVVRPHGRALEFALSDEDRRAFFTKVLANIREFFACEAEPEFGAVSAAIDWYQDSTSAGNQTNAYLGACIGLEAILGSDGHLDQMTNRLVDRYAFLLGDGREERDALAERYRRILVLRGKLVHAKQARLSAAESASLDEVQEMLMSVVRHELSAMMRRRSFG